MAKIKQIIAREILNAKGQPTIETTVILTDGSFGVASVPTGTSVGEYEATDLRDGDEKRYQGKGVLKAISNIEQIIAPALIGMEASKQPEIDRKMIEMDGTQNKGKLGANATLSVSEAVAKAAARSSILPLFMYLRGFVKRENLPLKVPIPLFNVLNGGLHAGKNLDFQEFLVIPASSKSYSESLNLGSSMYFALEKALDSAGYSTLVGDEGGFGPKLDTNKDAIEFLKRAADSLNLRVGFDIFFGLDAAASNFYSEQRYHIKDKTMALTSKDLSDYYQTLNSDYHLLYIEDPMSQDDWDGWKACNEALSNQTLIVGDDLTATNPYRLQMAINKKAINGIIIKPNQIGTVIESLAVIEVARLAGLKIIVSHRSGETNDDFIADFAVAASADYCKFGAPARGERVSKYNRLLQIERQLKSI